MARQELGDAALAVAQSVTAALAGVSGPCVVGVSGGADSLALAAGTAWAARRLPVQPLAVCVDHGLQEGSAQVADHAAQQCRELGFEAVVVRAEDRPAPTSNIEAVARDLRRTVLEQYSGPILLGHTRHDQAEQVLLGLARGSGPRSIAGMRPVAGRYLRPLLGLSRAVTLQACEQWGITPWLDPMNDDPRFLRVRARRLLPVLEQELGPGIIEALARTAHLVAVDTDYLDGRVPDNLPEVLPVELVRDLPDALRARYLRRWLLDRGAEPTSEAIERLDALVMAWRGQGPVHLAGLVVARRQGALVALPA